ncbi:MAG: 50S ribosomal protein L11 methyltransferase [Sulfurifustis sp.]
MPWLLIKLRTPRDFVPMVSDVLEACGALSVTIEGASAEPRLQRELEDVPLWSENRVVGLFPETTDASSVLAEIQATAGAAAATSHEIERLGDADWERAWMAEYAPIMITPGLWICPSWCTPSDPTAVNVRLDPGLAFGTGTHATTALCLQWIAEQTWTDRTVIDYGCGSGILAITALKLGASHAIGVDVDPLAVSASRDNAAVNSVSERYHACTPAELEDAARADVVFANILAGVLIDAVSELTRRVAPGGHIVLSGILVEQAEEVATHYSQHFLLSRRVRDGWALLAGPKRS